jgi:Xaa-Pro aminopeptidase
MGGSREDQAQESTLFQTDFPPEEFAARRAKIFDEIGDEAFALLQGAGPFDGFGGFRQSNEFYYLSGIEIPQSCLLLEGAGRRTILLRPEPGKAGAEGPSLANVDAETVKRLTGVDEVCTLGELSGRLAEARVLYTPHKPAEGRMATRWQMLGAGRQAASDLWDGALTRERRFMGLLRQRHPGIDIRDLTPILDALRAIKSPREVDMLRRAARLSGLAVMEAMRSTRPGVIEYELAAAANYIFLAGGARGSGYSSIVASGANAWFGHYSRNDSPLEDGDLLLMDCAPDYRYYTSDIGRMWPVGGTHSPGQRELYGFVVEYHKELLKRIRPGVMAPEIAEDAAEEMAKLVEKTTFSKPIYEEAARRMLEFRGHMSHPVGMSVHDVGRYGGKPLAPGVVFSVDPQMRVPEEKLYIRAEDTVAVTADGIENLTGFVPLELDDVEDFMRGEGMLQAFPPHRFDAE